MTVLFVDLVSLDGSKPEGTLKFTLERVVLGDPDTVPSSIEVPILDGKARVENLLPGRLRVRVNAGCWGKEWELTVPESGEHDVLELLGEQAPEFEHALWATLLGRVEALEQKPDPDLSGFVTKRELETQTSQPGAPAIKDITREVKFVDAELREVLRPDRPDAWVCLETPLDWRIQLSCTIESLKDAIGSGMFKQQIILQHESFSAGVAHVVGTVSGRQEIFDVYEQETSPTNATSDLDNHLMISLGDLREEGNLSLSLIATKMHI